MSELYHKSEPQYFTWDRKHYNTIEDQLTTIRTSRTVYVGNLSFFTTELQIYEVFSTVGPINRIIMGLNQLTKEPCGFCFVEYFSREHAAAALNVVSDTICDERPIRCDLDGGFIPGRQYGRGRSGGQRRDDFRRDFDQGRGGVVQERIPFQRRNRGYENKFDRRRNEDAFGRDIERDMAPRTNLDLLQTGLSVPRGTSQQSESGVSMI